MADPCVFYQLNKNPVWLFLHVDDIAVFGNDLTYFKNEIKEEFDMKDLGRAELLLGIKVVHVNKDIILTQENYVVSLLELDRMTNARTVSIQLIPNINLDKATTQEMD